MVVLQIADFSTIRAATVSRVRCVEATNPTVITTGCPMKQNRRSTWSDTVHIRMKARNYTLSVCDRKLLLLLLKMLVRRMAIEAGCDARSSAVSRRSTVGSDTWYGAHERSSRKRCTGLVIEVTAIHNGIDRCPAKIRRSSVVTWSSARVL